MSKGNHAPHPVPPGNRPQAGPGFNPTDPHSGGETGDPGDQPQDEQRRLGNFEGKGEHSRQQPGAANSGSSHNPADK